MKRFFLVAAVALLTLPTLAYAQELNNIQRLLDSIGRLISAALPIVAGLALLAFFWGVAMFIFAQADESKKVEAKKIMIWSVVALFVMVSVWGLVRFINNALGIQQERTPDTLPTIPGL
jgi:hypothetical protein